MMEQKNVELESERDSYDPVFFERLASVEDEHFWFRTRNHVIHALTRQVAGKLPPGCRVLEIGCGAGNVLRELGKACPHGLVVGSDLFFEGLKFARNRVAGPLVQADLHALPFDVKFDVVGLFDVIEHIPNDVEVLEHLARMIAPGGRLFLTVPASPSLWSYFDEGAHHCRRYRSLEMKEKLQSAGFEIEFLSHYMTSIFPLVWLARRLTRLASRSRSLTIEQATALTLAEFKITPLVNPLLTWILSLETGFLVQRRPLSFGASLLALARKPLVGTSGIEAQRR